jgi:DNA-binding winged helix-turn-helix (wHTH) protein
MKEQGIHNEPRLGSDCHERSNDPIVTHREACLRKAHTRPCEMNEIGADHVTSAGEAYLARTSRGEAGAALEFGRFRVLLRQRQLVADGVPIELGTRALDLLLVLLQADGSMVTKDELLSRGWPGIVVAEENLKVQICALRRALGEDRDFIRTEFGRGYRFTAAVRSTSEAEHFEMLVRARSSRAGRWRRDGPRCLRRAASLAARPRRRNLPGRRAAVRPR